MLPNIDPNWIIVDGFPLIFSLLSWTMLLLLGVWMWLRKKQEELQTGEKETSSLSKAALNRKQNQIYKRAGTILLVLGALGGFLPSILKLLTTGHVWSVNEQGPHPSVDASLYFHIPLAVIWVSLAAVQLWSGQVAKRRKIHRRVGYLAAGAGILGIGIVGAWIWPLLNDFSQGLESPTAGAGIYTILLGFGVIINGSLTIYHAKKQNLQLHKDFALMTLFWTLEPGIHRLYMWLMRLICWDCWSPENTQDMGIAIAKLPANISLIFWALLMAYFARRLNKVILFNILGQYMLWILGSFALISLYQGTEIAWGMVLISLLIAFAVGKLSQNSQ
ncbi:MAG: DUF2306 domain-containing protein [Bacteroidia bacterium]|nr:DUF2306 domain-containing protein [Bacteroidia bacterium]